MKKIVLSGIILISIIALFTQTRAGSTVIDRINTVAWAFSQSSALNTTSQTWSNATATKGNLVPLPTVTPPRPTWTNVPLNNSDPFDRECQYRFISTQPNPHKGTSPFTYATAVSEEALVYILHNSLVSHINSSSKTVYRLNGVDAKWDITKIEKICF